LPRVILVRDADAQDVPRLKQVFRDASWSNLDDRPLLGEHPEFLEWSGEPAAEGRTRLAAIGDEIVGFVSIIDTNGVIEIEDLFVDPAWMRHGAATALIDDLLHRARIAGATRVVVDGNKHAFDFYRSAGFEVQAEVALEHGTAFRMTQAVAP
jgi:GNAT superfamily N-acetyltransferase